MKGRSAQTTSQRFSGRSVLDISRTVRRYHRNHGPSTEARADRRLTAPVLSTQLPRPQAAYTAQPTIPFSGALWDPTEAGSTPASKPLFGPIHGWRIVETRGGAFPLVAVQFKAE